MITFEPYLDSGTYYGKVILDDTHMKYAIETDRGEGLYLSLGEVRELHQILSEYLSKESI